MQREPHAGIRLASMLLDHFFMCFILVMPMCAFMVLHFNSSNPDIMGDKGFQLIFLVLFFLYFLKDSFNGRSLAKRILKLQVVDHNTGNTASVLQCLIRNLFIIIWPVEVIVTLFRPQRRIGDLVAGTRVTHYIPDFLGQTIQK